MKSCDDFDLRVRLREFGFEICDAIGGFAE